MRDVEINTIEIIEDLKRQISELHYANAILNIKCNKLTALLQPYETESEEN